MSNVAQPKLRRPPGRADNVRRIDETNGQIEGNDNMKSRDRWRDANLHRIGLPHLTWHCHCQVLFSDPCRMLCNSVQI